MNMIEAIRSALDIVMDKDPNVVILGEDVGYFGGVFRCTDGLQRKYGDHRVIDAPIAEGGIVGAAIGMGVNGLRPVAEIQFADYIYPGFDQIVSELARLRYRSCGDFYSPVTIRTPCGGGIRGGQTHSQSPEAIFAHVSGIKTVMPSNPYDESTTAPSTAIPTSRPWAGVRIRKVKFPRVITRYPSVPPKWFGKAAS
jgi:2-oxoisovalerate dehydrogenase E1 component beta subunit